MVPLPQARKVPVQNTQSDVLTGEEVVISGIAGEFPQSKNVIEFMDNLYNKVDMITKDNPTFEHADLPLYTGKISDLKKFDAQFFRVTHAQAESMDSIYRKLLEQAYCAMYDAGINPVLYKGKKIGVFAATYNINSAKIMTLKSKVNHFKISGSSKTMLANRISYWLDAKGPSYIIDSHVGSNVAIEHALSCIKSGICEAAIVGSSEIAINEQLLVNMKNAGILCLDGKTRCFDKNGDGSAKSQAVGVIFLQKAKDAKRIYAEICCAGLEYGIKEGENFDQKRKPEEIVNFLEKVYSTSGIQANNVEYVEANGAAHPDADASELEAIAKVFSKEKPVMVGCVKSNMGDSQSVSGICAITKLCLAYYKGELAGNINCNDVLDIPAIQEGKVEVLTDNRKFNRGLTAVNCFCFTGTNCHIVLKGHYKPKDLNRYKINIPRLVLVAGRHEKGIEKILNVLKNQPIDPEFLGILNDIYKVETPGFTYRGFSILDTENEKTICLSQSAEFYTGATPPLWLLYSGMGSQWAGMGTELMRIPIFAAAVEKCQKILMPKGVDVVKILTSPDNTIFDNVLNCFIGIAAAQIGLTNILKEVGIVADNIIGHSVGEIGCAYYDGCFTDEEMILVAYARGLVSIQTKLIKGSMAAVGLGYQEVRYEDIPNHLWYIVQNSDQPYRIWSSPNLMLPLCPPDIEIACHNSSEVCTISGPASIMKTFVADLKAKGIFAKEVPCGNIAYHSRYIRDAGPGFLKHLKEIIKEPVKRSNNWISTSWPDEKRYETIAEMCSAEYHTNNLLSPVYFEEAARTIPDNAVVIEVAPHGLMQAILKRSHPKCIHIPLTRRGHDQPLKHLFEAFGKLYQLGYNVNIGALYPKIEYPVSTETSPLSHLVEWYHEEDWSIEHMGEDKRTAASRKLVISVQDDDYKFLAGHRMEGHIVLPEAALLFYVWETLAMYKNVDHRKVSIDFCDVKFHAEVVFDTEDTVDLEISINKGNNYFEVTRVDAILASGFINVIAQEKSETADLVKPNIMNESVKNGIDSEKDIEDIELNIDDIYNILKVKGYCYQNDFQTLHSACLQRNDAIIKMTSNWITFLDSLIQFIKLVRNYDGVSVPKIIKRLTIDMTDHSFLTTEMVKETNLINAHFKNGVTTCGGVKIDHIIFNDKPVAESLPDVLETMSIVPKQNLRTKPQEKTKFQEYNLINVKPGDIDGIRWEGRDVGVKTDNLVKICFAAPSMRDVQNAIGVADTKRSYGMDFSGIDNKGNRVMGLVAEGALASAVKPDSDLLWPVPKYWTLEEAATVPLPYVHAYYCLIFRGGLKPGQTVFVTGGAGALGQAAISICLSLGCKVYTTVRDIYKKHFLTRLFPDLNENDIGFSRDIGFFNMVVNNSKNKLCNIVINCNTGYLRELAMKCVGFNGYFLNMNDSEMRENKEFGMSYLWEQRNYVVVDLSLLFKPENIEQRKLLHRVISDGIAKGVVKPLTYVMYSAKDVGKAFRLISQSRHRGRALIKIRDTDTPMSTRIVAPRMKYSTNGAYLVVCDESVLGIHLVNHLINRGATNFIINMSAQNVTGFIQTQLAKWRKMGATVKLINKNLEEKIDCLKILNIGEKLNGIFITYSNHKGDSKEFALAVANLDNMSRNNHPELKYFAIIAQNPKAYTDKLIITDLENICDRRAEIGLPAIMVRAELEDCDEVKRSDIKPITLSTVCKVLETSLKQNYTKVFAYNKTSKGNGFLRKICRIFGTDSIDSVDDTVRVKELIYNEVNVEELKFALKENYRIDYSTETIKELTIHSIKNLGNTKHKVLNTNFNSGLAAFYNFVEHDIIEATEIFVPLPTLSSTAEGEINLHAKATNIMLIPGFEGHHNIFKPICASLKIRATTLQLGPDIPHSSIQQIAMDLKHRIKSRFTLEPKFYLLGYSFGVNVALEIAALLEKDGLVGVIYCLDSSPDALRVQLDAYLGKLSEEQIQNAVIKHMFHLMTGKTSLDLEAEIEKTMDWDEKLSICVNNLKKRVKFSHEYLRDIIQSFYRRISLAKSYMPEFKLKSDIVLLKGISHPNAQNLDIDYGLSKYTENPVKVYGINSDVALAPYDRRVPNIVNKLLDSTILDEFKAKNLCESYSFTTFD